MQKQQPLPLNLPQQHIVQPLPQQPIVLQRLSANISSSEQLSVQQIIQKLYHSSLDKKIEQSQPHSSQRISHLKQYITLYVQNVSRSDEFFNILCEHNIIAKMFSSLPLGNVGGVPAVTILQIFNLLLANTSNMSQLVYLFSHPLFHSYLLVEFNPLGSGSAGSGFSHNSSNQYSDKYLNSSEITEYYVQLLKTIILKLQLNSVQQHHPQQNDQLSARANDNFNPIPMTESIIQKNSTSLLKLFCNSKYPTFPLLLNCIVLALKRNVKEQLVRVTAQHCILQLIEVIGRKGLGMFYLTELHMMILFHELILEMIDEQLSGGKDCDNTLKYIVDLLKAIKLKQYEKPIILFFNILNNILVLQFLTKDEKEIGLISDSASSDKKKPSKSQSPSVEKTSESQLPSSSSSSSSQQIHSSSSAAVVLHIMFRLSNMFSEIQELTQYPSVYMTPMYRLFGQFMFSKYLNNISLASLIVLKNSKTQTMSIRNPPPNVSKLIKYYHEKNAKSLPQKVEKNLKGEKQKQQSAKEKENLLGKLHIYNLDNNENFIQLKEQYYKQSSQAKKDSGAISWIYGSIMKKINYDYGSTQFGRRVALLASVKFQITEQVKFMKDQMFMPACAYMFELLKGQTERNTQNLIYRFGQSNQDTHKTDINFNGIRDALILDKTFLKAIINVLQLVTCQIDSLYPSKQRYQVIQILQKKYDPGLLSHTGEVYFILHFKKYMESLFGEIFCGKLSNLTVPVIKLLHRICFELQPKICVNDISKLEAQISKLSTQLKAILKQKSHQDFFLYVESQVQKKMVQFTETSMEASQMVFSNHHNEKNIVSQSKNIQNFIKKPASFLKKGISSIFSEEQDERGSKRRIKIPFGVSSSDKINVAQKLLQIQLLRFALSENGNNKLKNLYVSPKPKPLYRIFQQRFQSKYDHAIMKNNSNLLRIQKGLFFQFGQKQPCVLQIKCDLNQFNLVLNLLEKDRLFFKCKVKEIELRPTFMKPEKEQQEREEKLNIIGTENYIVFAEKQEAAQFLQKLKQIKLQYDQMLVSSIQQYLQ